jgi:hypothetical protein
MPRLSRCTLFTLLFVGGCALNPAGGGNGGNSQPAGGNPAGGATPASTSAPAGNSGGPGGSTGGGAGGSTVASAGGSSGGSTASSSTAPACVADTSNLVTGKALICDGDTNIQLQGSFYPYGDGSSCVTANPFCSPTVGCCISGTTVVDTTYAKWGCGIGLGLNTSSGAASVKGVYGGPVKCFDITLTGSSGGNEVRIGFTQSTATAGKVSPFVSVAAFANGWSGQVCFTDAECPDWAVTAGTCAKAVGTAGTPYDLQIQISAGSTTASVGAFNVCVSKIAPVTDQTTTGTTSSCSKTTGQGTITGQYDTAHVTCNGQDYIVQNNAYGSSAGQTLTYGPGTTFKVTTQNGTGNTSGAPASFPSIFIGSNSNHTTTGNGLPKAVSALGTVQTSWTWADGVSGTYNATYDVWFSQTAAGDPAIQGYPGAAYLMVWLYKPTGAQPNGSSTASTTVAGKDWNLWVGTSNGKPCYSYVALQKLNSFSFDLNLFIKDAVQRGYIQNTWGLTNVFAGFEIWSGGVGLQTTDFAVTVK